VFGKGITLFKLFGFEVRLDWSWLIIAALITWSLSGGVFPTHYPGMRPDIYFWMGAAGALGLFVSIVLHEFGHSLVARRLGIPMRSITLFIFGGVAEMGKEPPNPRAEFLMSIAGPLVTVVLAGLFFGLTSLGRNGHWPVPVNGVLWYLAWINVLLLAFNLMPAFPLDGGRVLRSALWAWKKNLHWATRIAAGIGTAFGFVLMGLGILDFFRADFIGGIWLFIIGLFIRGASQTSYRQVVVREALAGESVRRFMTQNPVIVSPSATIRTIVDDFLYKYPYKFYPVVSDGHLLGCLNIDQVKQVPKEEWERRTAESVVAPCSQENVIAPETDAAKALATMSKNQVSRLMVVDHGQLLGVVALKDLVNYLSRKLELEGA
jgi:Zn-dependent protease/predicted transcriptional regulator